MASLRLRCVMGQLRLEATMKCGNNRIWRKQIKRRIETNCITRNFRAAAVANRLPEGILKLLTRALVWSAHRRLLLHACLR